jgi:hypothetical protein
MRSSTKFSLPFLDISTSFYEFWKFTLFSMNLSIHFWNFGKRKTFPASGSASGPWPTAPLGQQPVKAPLAGLAPHGPTAQAAWQLNTWACRRAHSRAVTAAAGGNGSLLGKVRLGVQDEHHRGGDHSSGNARERAVHRDGGAA